MRGFISTDVTIPSTVIVGEGMIGSAIAARRRRRPHEIEWSRPSDWSRPWSLGEDLREALSTSPTPSGLHVVWSAGSADMKATDEESAANELFRAGIESILDATGRTTAARLHLVSSAGVLGDPLGPNRFELIESAYQRIKAREEEVVRELQPDAAIHRISSVYAAPRGTARAGMIGILVANALRGVETPLFARTVTMRNYLHADDVAEAISRTIESKDAPPTTLIAARRSHAMNEVVATVKNVVRRPVPINYRPPANDHDMVFDPKHVSEFVPQRPLAAGVRLVYDRIVGR